MKKFIHEKVLFEHCFKVQNMKKILRMKLRKKEKFQEQTELFKRVSLEKIKISSTLNFIAAI